MRYSKPHLSYEAQLEQQIERGLEVRDRELAINNLRLIGYYRLSGYWYAWRRAATDADGVVYREDDFIPGHAFEDAVAIYSFDRRLRLLLLDALERIEIALRVQVAYVHGLHGPLAYLDPQLLGPLSNTVRAREELTNFELFAQRNRDLLAQSKEIFADHVRRKYDGVPPIWIATELWDFGQLARFYLMMLPADQSEVARAFSIPQKAMLASWIQALNYLRNLCAHHARLYRRILVVKPGQRKMSLIPVLSHLRGLSSDSASRLYPLLCVVVFLMRTTAPQSTWPHALRTHLMGFPIGIDASLEHYGFPSGWQDEAIWR